MKKTQRLQLSPSLFIATFTVALLVMAPFVYENEAFALHKGVHDLDHPYIPQVDTNGNFYDIYLDLETRQIVFYIDRHTNNYLHADHVYIQPSNSPKYYIPDYSYVASISGNWTKYTLTLSSEVAQKISTMYDESKAKGSQPAFGIKKGGISYYDEELGIINRNPEVQHGLEVVNVLDRTPHITLGGEKIIILEQWDTYSDTDTICTDKDDMYPVFSHNASTANMGRFVVAYTCIDDSGNMAEPAYKTLYVNAKSPPTIIVPSTPLKTIEGTELVYQIKSDSSSAKFYIVSHNVSSQAGHDPTLTTQGKLSWTPSESHGRHADNVYRITVNAIDAHSNVSPSRDIFVIVAEENSAPRITSFDEINVTHGTDISIDVSTHVKDDDIPKNTITYSKEGVGKIDSDTGVFTWMTQESDAGTYHVKFTVSDGTVKVSKIQTIIVRDITPPVIRPISDITISGDLPASVKFPPFNAIDAVDGPVKVTCTPASDSSFTKDVTLVTCTATDTAGNDADPVMFSVMIVPVPDIEPPTIIPTKIQTLEAIDTTLVTIPLPTITDNVDEINDILLEINITDGYHKISSDLISHSFTVGNHTIYWRATDTANNTAIATQFINVTSPVIVPISDDDITPPLPQIFTGDVLSNVNGTSNMDTRLNNLNAEYKQLTETVKKLKKDVTKLKAKIDTTFDNIADSDQKYNKQEKKIQSLEKTLDKLRTQKEMKKELYKFYTNSELVFKKHGVDAATDNHRLVLLSSHDSSCNIDSENKPCFAQSIYINQNRENSMVLKNIRNLDSWPNRTIYVGDTFEWTYNTANYNISSIDIIDSNGLRTSTSPNYDNSVFDFTSQIHAFNVSGVFNWSMSEYPSIHGTIRVIDLPLLQALHEDDDSNVQETTKIENLEKKITVKIKKIESLKDTKKDLRQILDSAKRGEYTLEDLRTMNNAEIKELSKTTKHVKNKIIGFNDKLKPYLHP